MALGNIKVDRTAVITKIEDAIKRDEKLNKDQTAAEPKLKKAIEKAEADYNKVVVAQADLSAEPRVDAVYHRHQQTTIVSFPVKDQAVVDAAAEVINEARQALRTAQQDVYRTDIGIREAKRDLSLLNASSEVTINVKTAGFLGYFE